MTFLVQFQTGTPIAEMATVLWLLIWGTKHRRNVEGAKSSSLWRVPEPSVQLRVAKGCDTRVKASTSGLSNFLRASRMMARA